jgi:hypothetical protein
VLLRPARPIRRRLGLESASQDLVLLFQLIEFLFELFLRLTLAASATILVDGARDAHLSLVGPKILGPFSQRLLQCFPLLFLFIQRP